MALLTPDEIWDRYKYEERYERDAYMGLHNRCDRDYDGWTHFEVYKRDGQYWWSAVDTYSQHVGFEYGPYDTSREAFHDA